MIIYPAIDLKDGTCVRLLRGEFSSAHRVASDPVQVAEDFYRSGARFIHMVDLDGALSGEGKNREIVHRVCTRMSGKMKVELGGGLRKMEDLKAAFDLGVWRCILGSAAIQKPAFLSEAFETYGERISVGIDAKNGQVMTAGWTENSGVHYLDFARQLEKLGIGNLIFTDISKDGALQGPNFDQLSALRNSVSCQITASGGVTTIQDIAKLKEIGFDGAIIGKAYYEGTLSLSEAVQIGGEQC